MARGKSEQQTRRDVSILGIAENSNVPIFIILLLPLWKVEIARYFMKGEFNLKKHAGI